VRTFDLFRRGLRDEAREHGWLRALAGLGLRFGEVLRDSFPDRRRMRFGDIHYDLDHNVNTTWANVGFRTRLREALIGATYQTTEPVIFEEAMDYVRNFADLARFTFIDLGSGKGRVLLMAAEYPFRRIVGVELLPELDAVARENTAREPRIECVVADARTFTFPDEALVVFMFNPFPPWVLRHVLQRFQQALERSQWPAFVVLHNPIHELAFADAPALKRLGGTDQFVVYATRQLATR
jgi:predicted RNA methylase